MKIVKQPIFEIIFLNDNIEKNIIQDYWAVYDNALQWKNKIDEVAKKYGTSMSNVSSYAKENSRFKLYCSKCLNLIGEYKLKSELNWQNFGSEGIIKCNGCDTIPKVKYIEKVVIKEVEIKVDKAEKMNIAYKTEQWKDLNQPELEVLIKVAESITTKEIYSKVFPDENWKSEYNKYWWKILNKLDRMNLIWIDREENGKIIEIHKHGRLYQTLLIENPELIIKRKEPRPVKKYGFSIERNADKIGNQPDFLGKVKINFDVNIKKNSSLTCAVWYNKVANLYIRIEENTD